LKLIVMMLWRLRQKRILRSLSGHTLIIQLLVCLLFICPIAIAYSMGQIIKSVCVCQSVSVSVYLSVCPSASTLTVAFLDRFSLAQMYEPLKGKTSSLRVNIVPPLPLFCPQNPHFRPRGPENPCKY